MQRYKSPLSDWDRWFQIVIPPVILKESSRHSTRQFLVMNLSLLKVFFVGIEERSTWWFIPYRMCWLKISRISSPMIRCIVRNEDGFSIRLVTPQLTGTLFKKLKWNNNDWLTSWRSRSIFAWSCPHCWIHPIVPRPWVIGKIKRYSNRQWTLFPKSLKFQCFPNIIALGGANSMRHG